MNDSELLKKQFEKLNNKLIQISKIDDALGGICEKYWVVYNGKKYLFKYPFKYNKDYDYSDFGEVFTSYLSYLLGFKCVKSIFCENIFKAEEENHTSGVLVEDYRNKFVTGIFSLSYLKDMYAKSGRIPINEIIEICEEFAKDKNLNIDKNLLQELKDMALIDYLLIQTDRHSTNIEFLIEKRNGVKTLKLAPMFDNGQCLLLWRDDKEILHDYNEYIKNKIIPINVNNCNDSPKLSYTTYNTIEIVEDLAKELLINSSLMKLYKNFKNINLRSEIEFIKKLYKRELPKVYVETIILAVENRIKLLDLELAKLENKGDNNDKTLL